MSRLESLRGPRGLVVAFVLVVAAGLVDFGTGFEIRVYPLYFAPIALAALTQSRRWVALIVMLSGLSWLASNRGAGLSYSHAGIWVVNACTQLGAFSFVAWLLASLRRAELRATAEARTDALTSLLNRRGFVERAEVERVHAARGGSSMGVAVLDVDHFKEINDRFGHAAGDAALREIAMALVGNVRRDFDVCGRLGGDEFALVLPDVAIDDARALLERLREHVRNKMAAHGWPATLSIGLVVWDRPPESVEQMLREADALAYDAKRSGRNCTHSRHEAETA